MKAPFKLTNTLTRSLVELHPLVPPQVSIYTCGPTVYDNPHIGNLRTYIFEDVLVKSLRRFGYSPYRVMNITDVGHLTSDADEGEDKLQVGARREGLTAWDIAKKYEERFLADMDALNLEKPAKLVRATETIQQQIEFIQGLEDRGYTYTTADGVYFDSSKVENYGELARLDVSGLQEGIRVAVGEKRNKTDFALWKFSPASEQRDMEWESPWGKGFPGWHIECSAIIRDALGDSIDIHCGGVDHISVHHPNEMAQSESLTDKPLAQIWVHGDFLQIDGGKMGKSLGNMYNTDDFAERGIDPLAFRLFCYSASYRSKLNFTWETLATAARQLEVLRAHTKAEPTPTEAVTALIEKFNTALADDMNMPVALSVVFEALNLEPGETAAFLQSADEVLSLDLFRHEDVIIPEEVLRLLQERHEARQVQDWDRSDALRHAIAEHGFQVQDKPTGQEIQKIIS